MNSQIEIIWQSEIILQRKATPNNNQYIFIQIILQNNFFLSSHDSENFQGPKIQQANTTEAKHHCKEVE